MAELERRTGEEIQALYAQSSLISALMFGCLVAAGLMQVAVALVIRLRVVRPIIAVKNEMLEISKGNLNHPFALQPDTSEIGMLVHSIVQTKSELNKYITNISQNLGAMAGGNMNVTVDIEYLGDFASIKQSMNVILDSLNDVLAKIDAASGQIAGGAGQLSGGAQALSQGASRQAGTIQELSAALGDITRQITDTAASVKSSSELTGRTGEDLAASNNKMYELQEAMGNISKTSAQIGLIVQTIDDIAFQTNILALNAAVEAARAGEAGKGFAVVADEVRNLATKSAEAAQNTAGLIEQALQAVRSGEALAQDTAASLQRVQQAFGELVATLGSVSNATATQSEYVAQINAGMDQISSVVQTNSATAQQSAAASEQLSGQSEAMKELVGRFHLRGGPGALPRHYGG